jgi:tetratricopeptide (TPR) repeat protein
MTARESIADALAVTEALIRSGRNAAAVRTAWDLLGVSEDPRPRCLIAEALLAGDFYDEALRFATEAIELDPSCAPAYLTLGLAYDRRGGMWDQSILVWHELAEVVPDLVTAHVQLGEAFAAADFQDEAMQAWRRALELDPREARAMYDLSVAALRREGVATALPGFRKAGELDPSQDGLFFALLAAELTEPAHMTEPAADEPATRAQLLHAAIAHGRRDELYQAMELVRGLLAEDDEDAPALSLAAWAYLKQDAVNEAIACAAHAVQVAPGHPPALYCLGVGHTKHPGLARHAAHEFTLLAEAVPSVAMPHVLLAESLLALQHYAEAGAAYRRAVAIDPTCVRARFGLAAACLTEGRYADAMWEIRRAAYHDTRRQGLFWRLYDAYSEGGGYA